MHWLDWLVLLGGLGFIVTYGVWKTRKTSTAEAYLRGRADTRWWAVCISVMATQASAITFLSTPGQGYLNGVGFVQFYFGLPLAMLVVSFVFIPLYYKWQVFTAYEFIGRRFDQRTRALTAILFLIQRGMGAGITIYGPSIVLSKVIGWPLSWTCIFIGVLVTLYTTTGGARAVGVTHKQQMTVMIAGLFVAFGLTIYYLSDIMTFGESLRLAGALGKLDAIDLSWNPETRYTLWSGLLGGFFLQLAYFGTDQSQVQRYLSGQDAGEARRGMLWNGVLKIPMQFLILLTGVLVFVFYLFNQAPIHWNQSNIDGLGLTPAASVSARELEQRHADNLRQVTARATALLEAQRGPDVGAVERAVEGVHSALAADGQLRDDYRTLIRSNLPGAEPVDSDYIFVSYIMDHLPIGIIGLLLAMIFSAGMSSTSAELSALATTTTVDLWRAPRTDAGQVRATKWATVAFGFLALAFAALFSLYDNLIQAVNEIGSIFYGTILGVFLTALFVKRVQGTAVFIAALIAQAVIIGLFVLEKQGTLHIAFLWYNMIAPGIVVVLALLLQALIGPRTEAEPRSGG